MSKNGSHDPFGHLKHKLWPKERLGVKFDSRPLKVENHLDYLVCKWHATYHGKALDKGYNFISDLISIEGLHRKLCAPKVTKGATLGILRLPLWSPRKNVIWMPVPWPGTEYTIRGKVVASPKSGLWWILWVWISRGLS
jgi:hypothetical protein